MEEALALARTLTGVGEDDELLVMFCRAAENALEARLRQGVTPADCSGVFFFATALLAAADWRESRSTDEGGVSFRAGEVSVTAQPAAERAKSIQALRTLAWRMMAPYVADGGFCFRGVRA